MADVYTRIGYIKGATGAQGAQGAKGDTGDAATIQVGSVTTVPYGQTANVVNSGTEQAAVFDFTIPQGRPGQQTTEMDNLLLNSITTSSASFPIPAVGETGKVIFGKITKWFSDMAALVATKLNAANVVNNLTTTASGYALDARQGKVLHDNIENKIKYKDVTYTLSTSYTSKTASISPNLDVSTYRLISCEFTGNNDYYYLIATDGIYPDLSIVTTNNIVQLIAMNKNSLQPTANRNLVIRVGYIEI